ncbi:family 1 glycosylhydrolase [Massilia horti]|nr:family 1 glycosylhydrolase [Massilia horti]
MAAQTTSDIPRALGPASMARSFIFCTGIENSSPTITGPDGRKQRVDEMESCGHYQHWREDFKLVHDLGLRCLRYGPPYYRTHVGPGHYDWSFADETFNELKRLGIVPIADLCHFGVPDWLGNFQNTEFPRYFAEYAKAFAQRFPWVRLYTPVNEMLVTAEFSALIGFWNEQRADDRSFVTALTNVVEANIRASEALREACDPWFVQSESTRYFHPYNPDAVKHTLHLNERRFLTLDLNYSHAPSARMYEYLRQNGMTREKFNYFMDRNIWPSCIMGTDYYENNELIVYPDGSSDICNVLGYYGLTRQYYSRFRLPIMHTETNQMQEQRARHWLERQWANVLRLRQEGNPIIGFTWYSLTDQIDWDIGLREKLGHVNSNGLFTLDRKIRPAGEEFKRIVSEWSSALANTDIRF